MIGLAASENLIRFQLIHPLAECIELAERLRERFDLVYCEVAPSRDPVEEDIATIATTAALYLENILNQHAPVTVAVGNGSTMRDRIASYADDEAAAQDRVANGQPHPLWPRCTA